MDARLPRYQQLRDELAARIGALEWGLDEALPTEHELAQTYGLAVGTVRRAIDLLEQEGRVARFQGRGTFIRRANFDQSLFRFFRFHASSGERRLPQSRILARDILRPPAPVAKVLGIAIGNGQSRALRLQRLRLLDQEPLLVEEIWLPLDRFEALTILPLEDFGNLLYPLYEQCCAQIVARATEQLTVVAASAADMGMLALSEPGPVVVIERTAYAHDGRALEWRVSRGNAAHFKYEIELR